MSQVVTCNSHGVNDKIHAHILSDQQMRDIGFSDCCSDQWFFCRTIQFPSRSQYKNFDIDFSVTIPKDGSDIRIDVIDNDFGQPYDYQCMLENNPMFEPCLIVQEQVEQWMKFLTESGVLSGHVAGEYM